MTDSPMKMYRVTYFIETTQPVSGHCIQDVEAFAKNYARDSGLVLKSIYLELPPKPAA